ncbi:methyltransferase domain-containing protein [Chryseobacterium sp. G0201]|uniref:methyltransferase domain-containing protein n=1 Tax=Chryseobacterium sp. G0201 TaxID=2487065 RepID=UPI000F4F6B6A|nr:methyltransferase domain-containing protein [Chryseobacterium sp. G0201]AZA51788.1 methyltransferase domain-containing protein [Chryseobacterium sp. G0201]
MIFEQLKLNIDVKDSTFNELYPSHIKELANRHWTPIAIARMAAEYLAEEPNSKVLDIGAGAGKFCLVGAASTKGMFFGVEQRASLTKISKKIADRHKITNVEFIHSNINEISFLDYDAFYFFNSFYENIDTSCLIDDTVLPDRDLYYDYSEYVKGQLDKTPIGTRLATYWSKWDEIPSSFDLTGTACNGLLNFWKKIS